MNGLTSSPSVTCSTGTYPGCSVVSFGVPNRFSLSFATSPVAAASAASAFARNSLTVTRRTQLPFTFSPLVFRSSARIRLRTARDMSA